MERIAVVAGLKPGTEARARALVQGGPPFDLAGAGVARHAVYVSTDDVVFVFEGEEIERRLHELVTAPGELELGAALDDWRDIVDGPARIARVAFTWERNAGRA